VDLRKWAAEGLAYLTLDADVKEDLVEDTDSLKSIIDLAKVPMSFIVVFIICKKCYNAMQPERTRRTTVS